MSRRPIRFTALPAAEHPFHYDRYSLLHREIDDACDGFAEAQHSGHPSAAALYQQASAIRQALVDLWSAVQDAERSEEAAR